MGTGSIESQWCTCGVSLKTSVVPTEFEPLTIGKATHTLVHT